MSVEEIIKIKLWHVGIVEEGDGRRKGRGLILTVPIRGQLWPFLRSHH